MNTMVERDAGGLWQKGQSGNPGGRPKISADVKALARQHTQAAIDALVKNLSDKNRAVANNAAQALLDRGYGRPAQAIVGDSDLDPIIAKVIVTGVQRPDDASGD